MRYLKYLLIVGLLFWGFKGISQENTESSGSGIALNIIVPNLGEHFDQSDQSTLESRLQQMATNYGIGGASFNPNFVLVPNVVIDEYKTIGSAPPRTLAKIEVILKIGNAQSKTIFSTASMKATGVGETKDEALSEAIGKIETEDDKVKDFVKGAKEDIISYYNEQCDKILKKASANAESENFNKAFRLLNQIPSGAQCYEKAMNKVEAVFKKYQETRCSKLLSRAKAAYGAGDMETAARFLALIPSSSECSKKAEELSSEMKEERLDKYEKESDIRKLRVEAAKDIAITFGENQPDKKVDIRFLKAD